QRQVNNGIKKRLERKLIAHKYHRASVTASASRPSITARGCVLDPPSDFLISSFLFVSLCAFEMKLGLWVRHGSRLGSYDTLSNSSDLGLSSPRVTWAYCVSRVTVLTSW